MKNLKFLLLSALSGLILALAWPAIFDLSFLVFIAFVPLLIVEEKLASSKRSALAIFSHAYLAFFIFNLLTTWWIKNADTMGAVMAIFCNSFFMATVFWFYHLTKKYVGKKEGHLGFILFWIAFEYLHLNWELSWTWLSLGNVFASTISYIQWYEFTGVLGGSLWIVTLNMLLFLGIKNLSEKGLNFKLVTLALLVLLVPIFLSIWRYTTYEEKGEFRNFVVVQPNIDPYHEKFGGLAPSVQIDKMVELAKTQVDEKTDYLIFPETAFPEAYWEHEINYLYGTEELRKLIERYTKLKIEIGLSTSVLYTPGMKLSETANEFGDGSGFYDNYNSSILIDSSLTIQLHHKSKLVLGVEKLPFVRSIPLMKMLSINLGGTSGGLGTQEKPSVFVSSNDDSKIAPIICYESIYGEYVTQYAQQGANIFTIITNDGWWGDTPGYKQHLAYASLRAIENRRGIARSANTGISGFINQKGEILTQSNWWEAIALKGSLVQNNELTFYTKHGDYLGRIAGFVSPLLLLLTLVRKIKKSGNGQNRSTKKID